MKEGIVKFFNEERGFGFITVKDSKKSIFVHVSALQDKICDNDSVTFEVQEGTKGPMAINVSKAISK